MSKPADVALMRKASGRFLDALAEHCDVTGVVILMDKQGNLNLTTNVNPVQAEYIMMTALSACNEDARPN